MGVDKGKKEEGKEENRNLLCLSLTGRKCGRVLSTNPMGAICWLVAGQEDMLTFDPIGCGQAQN